MNGEVKTYENTFFELAEFFSEQHSGSSNQTVQEYFAEGTCSAAERIRQVRRMFKDCERELMASKIGYDTLCEHIETTRRYSWEFDECVLRANSKSFVAGFSPQQKADILRSIGLFVDFASIGQQQVSLQRGALQTDLTDVSEALINSQCSDFTKEVVGIGLRSLKAMLAVESTFDDEEIRNEIRKLFLDYVSAYKEADARDKEFSEKITAFVAEHGANSLGYVALANDAFTNTQLLLNFLGGA